MPETSSDARRRREITALLGTTTLSLERFDLLCAWVRNEVNDQDLNQDIVRKRMADALQIPDPQSWVMLHLEARHLREKYNYYREKFHHVQAAESHTPGVGTSSSVLPEEPVSRGHPDEGVSEGPVPQAPQ